MRKEETKRCRWCGDLFTARHPSAQLCSPKCRNQAYAASVAYQGECSRCHRIFVLTADALRQRKRNGTPLDVGSCCITDGEGNTRWRGGHRYWSPGRFGRDKDGLSWKVQRRLAWERDSYTCRGCGKHKDGWRPDVHHILPFRVSQSHALENLKCYCRKCHLREEAKVQEQWGTTDPNSPARKRRVCACGRNCIGDACGVCNSKQRKKAATKAKRAALPVGGHKPKPHRRAPNPDFVALRAQKEALLPEVLRLHAEGYSLAQIAESLPIKVHRQTIYYWCKFQAVKGYSSSLKANGV